MASAGKIVGTTVASRMLGVSEPTLRRWSQKGIVRLVMITPGGRRRYAEDDIVALRAAMMDKANRKMHYAAFGKENSDESR